MAIVRVPVRKALVVIAAAMALALATQPLTFRTASAYTFHGCHFGQTSVTYDWVWVGDYSTQVSNAVGDWNASPVPGSIQWNTSKAGDHIQFNRLSLIYSYWALTEPACSGVYPNGNVRITLNDATMASLSGLQKRRVIVHESVTLTA